MVCMGQFEMTMHVAFHVTTLSLRLWVFLSLVRVLEYCTLRRSQSDAKCGTQIISKHNMLGDVLQCYTIKVEVTRPVTQPGNHLLLQAKIQILSLVLEIYVTEFLLVWKLRRADSAVPSSFDCAFSINL
jgi:hypothetical protein